MFINTTFLIFQDGGRPPSWIFKSSKFSTAGPVRRANMRHHAKCCADLSNKLKQSTDYWPINANKVRHSSEQANCC